MIYMQLVQAVANIVVLCVLIGVWKSMRRLDNATKKLDDIA